MKFEAVSAGDCPSFSTVFSTPACNVERTRCDPETLDPTASLEVDSYANLITTFDTMEERERQMNTLMFYDQIILNRFDYFS